MSRSRVCRGGTWGWLLAALFLLSPGPATGQETTDILTGRITNEEGQPLDGVQLDVTSLVTGITRTTLSNSEGKYLLLFPDGGGAYEILVTFIGLADQVVQVRREADEEVLITHVTMTVDPVEVEGFEVAGRQRPPGRGDEGTRGISLTQGMIDRLPITEFDPSLLAALAPGVILTAGDTASGLVGFSVAGQRDVLNQVTLDGGSITSMLSGGAMGAGTMSLPEEGVRATRVMTNTYDVSRGQFSGGLVAMTSSRGVNRLSGSSSLRLQDPALQSGGSTFQRNAQSQQRVSGGVGGPIIQNKLFYNVSFTLQRRNGERSTLATDGQVDALRLGAQPDSVARFLQILDDGYGVSSEGETGLYDQGSDGISLMGRMDIELAERHTAMLRLNGSTYKQENTRVGTLELLQNGGEGSSNSAGGMLSVSSRLGGSWINQLRFSANVGENSQDPYLVGPEGRVRLSSSLRAGDLGGGLLGGQGTMGGRGGVAQGISTLVFGGDRNLPTSMEQGSYELSDELSFLLGFTHRLKVGGILSWNGYTQDATGNLLGTYLFDSLDDLDALRPSSYTRTLNPHVSDAGALNWATYLGDTWRPSDPLQVTMGFRLEGTDYGVSPEYNPTVESSFGARTDQVPTEVHVSPRVGFSYRLSDSGEPQFLLRGGIGEFRGQAPLNLVSSVERATGLPGSEVQLTCLGDAVPTPDWQLYRADPSQIPTTCVGGVVGTPSATLQPNVTVLSPDFQAPRSWRASLGLQRQISPRLSATLDLTYARGVGLYGARDLNLDLSETFSLVEEGGRPFFGNPSGIVEETGAVSMATSRIDPAFDHVLEVYSDLESSTYQLTAGLAGLLPFNVTGQMSYTYTHSRDPSSFSRGSALQGFASNPASGNPNTPSWATSDFERRHAITGLAVIPVGQIGDVSFIGRLNSGAPFTPMVAGDINGDGARNDPAFLFDPSTVGDPVLAQGMTQVLQGASSGIRDCLNDQLGAVASRNSCRGPWTASLDMSTNLYPDLSRFGLGDRVSISVDAMNVLGGLDQLFHGSDGLKGWGGNARPDRMLLYPTGFDPSTQAFTYAVNERFGETQTGRGGMSMPFQLQISASIQLGDMLGMGFGGGRGGFGGMMGGFGGGMRGGGGIAGGGMMRPGGGARAGGLGRGAMGLRAGGGMGLDASTLASRFLANPLPVLLELADTLGLSEDQVDRLNALSNSLQALLDPRIKELERELEGLEAQEMIRAFQDLRPLLEEGREEITEALEAAEDILTKDQWDQVPAAIKSPFSGGRLRR